MKSKIRKKIKSRIRIKSMTAPASSLSLAGETTLLTGASRGLGAEIAMHLCRAGSNLLLVARDATSLDAHVAELQKHKVSSKQRITSLPVDLADAHQLEYLLDRCEAEFSPVQIVINNAAIQGPISAFETVDFAQWRAVFETNFFAVARICQRLIPGMRKSGWGKIVNLSGGGATSPRPDVSAYGVSKCAVVRFSETLAEELKGSGIDINCVAPGAMNTRMLDELLKAGPHGVSREFDQALKQRDTGGAPPARAAELIAWLASPASDGITGRLIAAMWDRWEKLAEHRDEIATSDIYTLRRIMPEDRGLKW
jgi:NAD(P)-dependent dehydrogenase (short-subunit alcohol dehydrogenase family)